jgi:hypothetical protein
MSCPHSLARSTLSVRGNCPVSWYAADWLQRLGQCHHWPRRLVAGHCWPQAMQASWSGVGVVQDDADPAKPSPVFERYRRTSSARRPWGRPGYASISCVAVLRAYRRRQAAERVAFGSGFCDHGRVFTRPGGEPLNPDAVSSSSRGGPPASTCRRSGPRSPAWLGDDGAGGRRALAEQLGHASVRVTLDTYSHVTPGVRRDAVARVASRFLDLSSSGWCFPVWFWVMVDSSLVSCA